MVFFFQSIGRHTIFDCAWGSAVSSSVVLPPRLPREETEDNDVLISDRTTERGSATRQAADPRGRRAGRPGALGGRAPRRAALVRRRTGIAPGSRSPATRRGRDRSGLSAAWQSDG